MSTAALEILAHDDSSNSKVVDKSRTREVGKLFQVGFGFF